jgi:hypothetical protein
MMFPPTAATLRICFPANQRSISTISRRIRVPHSSIDEILLRQTSSRRLRVTDAPISRPPTYSVMEFNSGILIGTMVTKINCAVVTMHNCQTFSFERPLEAKPHKNLSEKVSSLRTAMFNHLATLNVI